MEEDAMPHLLALRYFCQLWRPSFDQPSVLFGGYPGVDIFDHEATN
jgi:hypothetical protein